MKRTEAAAAILAITKKYNWDSNETYKLNEILREFGKTEFDSAKSIGDIQIINQLEHYTELKTVLVFNHDHEDGYFLTALNDISSTFYNVLDINKATKRESLREAMIAAIEYLKNNSKER